MEVCLEFLNKFIFFIFGR